MEKNLDIIEGTTVEVNNNEVVVTGPKGELRRKFFYPKTTVTKEDSTIKVTSTLERRENKAIVGTWISHVKNMMIGVTEGYEMRMKIVHKHFPMSVKAEGEKFSVQNIFGQKAPRATTIMPGVDVKIQGDEVTITGIDKEMVGNTLSNIEKLCKKGVRRDRRKFYDGIYKVE